MDAEQLQAPDKQLQTDFKRTLDWLDAVMMHTRETDRNYVVALATATLQCLRLMLPPEVKAEVARALPTPMRGSFFTAWTPGESRKQLQDVDEFVACVRPELEGYFADAVVAEDVFLVLSSLFTAVPGLRALVSAHLPDGWLPD